MLAGTATASPDHILPLYLLHYGTMTAAPPEQKAAHAAAAERGAHATSAGSENSSAPNLEVTARRWRRLVAAERSAAVARIAWSSRRSHALSWRARLHRDRCASGPSP